MSTSSRSELDESTLTPEEAKSNQKTSCSKFTRLANYIENAIALSKSIEAGELMKQSLKDLMKNEEVKAVVDLDNCFRCLGRNHLCRECKRSLRREVCNNASHHTLIHGNLEQHLDKVWVKTTTGEYRRPVVKLCLLRLTTDSSFDEEGTMFQMEDLATGEQTTGRGLRHEKNERKKR
ncbi:hypothetical protein DAPPUDRAFT_254568 [Daphnia pulex]|uniref:Uncharacterized protein n=1 Tax=Daphnia pulex TaxID=6669 RepID=E9H7C4_DAPPU|nr:hypothetical protein DAPPUDRAFT_254568 [Daphnia pulex]|eukprot:EFX72352.1 hypothetical protein DAPPUDRAFT_254568 [Daphnia pulex]